MLIRLGDIGPEVLDLNMKLYTIGYSNVKQTNVFDAETSKAVGAFQLLNNLLVDRIYGPQTKAVLDRQVIYRHNEPQVSNTTMENRFLDFVKCLVAGGVRYAPGRSLFRDNHFLVTKGPGGLGLDKWKFIDGNRKPCASLHCSSLVNTCLSYMINRNEDFCHAGNIPSLFDLVKNDNTIHKCEDGEPYRGYSPRLQRFASSGDTAARWKLGWMKDNKQVDGKEILDRKEELPFLSTWIQSDRKANGGWNWWHHVGHIAKLSDGKLYRLAADGYVDKKGRWSGNLISWGEFQPKDNVIYQLFRVDLSNPEHTEEYPIICEV